MLNRSRIAANLVLVVALVLTFTAVTNETASAATGTIDFEEFAEGTAQPFIFSTILGVDWNATGTGFGAMIFDAECPGGCSGGDPDLFNPGQGKILIVSEDGDSGDPDDAVGGTLTITFSQPVMVLSLKVFDTEEGGTIDGDIPIPSIADGASQTIAVNSTVTQLVIAFTGSGAVDDIEIEVEDRGGEGCTPGYWKQPHHLDSWPAGVNPGDSYDATFGVTSSDNPTLLEALDFNGGKENALYRHATAAYLNALSPDVEYPYIGAEVIALVQQAYASGDFNGIKDQFDAANNLGCPLN